MPDGKALQSGTSHDLGQNFAKAYDIKFVDADGAIKHAYTTSWGVSWRMLGALIMVHGDDRGLRIPPKMAPIEAIVIPIVRSNDDRAIEACTSLARRLSEAGFRVRVDARDEQPGWKYSEWDLRGVPVRIEIGPRDVDAKTAVLARRDRNKEEPGQRRSVALAEVPDVLRELLDEIQDSLYGAGESVFGRAHVRDDRPRRVLPSLQEPRGHDRHRVVRTSRVRGARKGANDRDDARRAQPRGAELDLRSLRRAGESQGIFCAVLLGPCLASSLRSRSHGALRAAYAPSVAQLDATARAVGNRRDVAQRIGASIFSTRWPAEVSQISANSAFRASHRRHSHFRGQVSPTDDAGRVRI